MISERAKESAGFRVEIKENRDRDLHEKYFGIMRFAQKLWGIPEL